MTKINGAVVVITGASSGIGEATAHTLAAAGATLVLAARNETKLSALADAIRANGGTAEYRITDVTDRADVASLVDFAIAQYGRVDVFINNAGLMLFSFWRDVVVDDWDKMISTNVHGYLNGIAAILPRFLEQGAGHILNMSSVSGHSIGPASGVYSATKHFVRAITDSLRMEVGVDSGIQISMISPGAIATGWEEKVTDEGGRGVADSIKGVAISSEKVAEAVLYALDQPADVAINDVIIHPTRQAW
ncbi:SDR family oxidoreductase [Microbacterium sp. GXF0217]